MLCTTMHQMLVNASDKLDLAIFSGQRFREKVEAALTETDRWEKRKRGLGAVVVVTFVVFMSLHRQLGIRNVLKRLLNLLREHDSDLSLVAVTPEAVCHARKRAGVEPLRVLFNSLAGEVRPAPSFHGLRTWGYDGVRFTLPDTPSNEERFGRPKASRGKAAFPQMLAVALVDTQSRQVRDVAMGRCTDSERDLARPFVQHLGPEDLTMMDRGCSSASQFEAFMSRGSHVLGRISKNWKPKKFQELSDGSWIVEVRGYDDTGSRKAKKERQRRRKRAAGGKRKGTRRRNTRAVARRLVVLRMRLIEYQVNGRERCRLLTDLLDAERFPARDLALEYHRRWECELAYDELKTHLATVTHGTLHTVFRSKTADGVEQEAYGTFIAYNLIRALMVEAGEAHGVPPLEISFVGTLEIVKMAAPRLEGAAPDGRARLVDQLLRDIADCRNARPRRPRWNRREIKVKMSKYPLKRRSGRGMVVDFVANLQVRAAGPTTPEGDPTGPGPLSPS